MTDEEFKNRIVKLMNNEPTKLSRIKNSNNYSKELAYSGATSNIVSITHSGKTPKGVETVVQTITYENPAVDGSRITNISFS